MHVDGMLRRGAHYLFFFPADGEGAVGVTGHEAAIGYFSGHQGSPSLVTGTGPDTLLGRKALSPTVQAP